MKTTDDIYLKDLLEQDVLPALNLYNSEVDTLVDIVAYRFDDKAANSKIMYNLDTFDELSDIEEPAMKTSVANPSVVITISSPLETVAPANDQIIPSSPPL